MSNGGRRKVIDIDILSSNCISLNENNNIIIKIDQGNAL